MLIWYPSSPHCQIIWSGMVNKRAPWPNDPAVDSSLVVSIEGVAVSGQLVRHPFFVMAQHTSSWAIDSRAPAKIRS